MVGRNRMKQIIRTDISRLRPFIEENPVLAQLAAGPGDNGRHFLVGGAVRDLLIGFDVIDLDIVTEGDVAKLAEDLAGNVLLHERFGTAELTVDGLRVDIATARRESYRHPGALPEVEPASIEEDLIRRDFTINAMAIGLDEPETLIDPHGGQSDLQRGVIRVMHEKSFLDDPTRALRAARYSARYGFDLDPGTAGLLSAVDLGSVSRERIESELELIAREATGLEALRLVSAWGLIDLDPGRLELAANAVKLLESPIWQGRVDRAEVMIEALFHATPALSPAAPESPYSGFVIAGGLQPAELVVNRANGVEWLDLYESEWSLTRLSISGDDLVSRGLPQGPAIGLGLAAALEAKLNRGVNGFDAELEVAVGAAKTAMREAD